MAYRIKASEKEIENSILIWLNSINGMFAFKVETVGMYDEKRGAFRRRGKNVVRGTSDILFCFQGLFGAIEVKSEAGYQHFMSKKAQHTVTELAQKEFLRIIHSLGGLSLVTCSLEQVQEYLKSYMGSA